MKFSNLFKIFKWNFNLQLKWSSTNTKYKLKDEIQKLIENEEVKPKKHPGIVKKNVELPKWIIEVIQQNMKEINRNEIYKESIKLANYLFSRQLPLEHTEINKKYLNIEQKLLQLNNERQDLLEEEFQTQRKLLKGKVLHKLKSNVYAWKPIEYNNIKSLIYMATRSIPEYFVLTTIFNEIKARDAYFNPQTMFDFGSGVGSTLWVAMQTWTNINEYMGIDISNEMNDLSKRIIKKSPLKIKDVFHRQYLPVSNLKYDLIVSAYSFMELPNTRQRLEVITKLWKKTRKYLVIVEQGTNNGFKVINEAREFINHINKNIQEKYFIFAPCPHSNKCPRYIENRTPCNFLNQYLPLQFSGYSKRKLEFFSYIVFKKGEATENDRWYRVVRNSIIHKNHVQCNLCTSNGQLKQIVFKKKYEKSLYKCAKRTRWGDRLPIEPNFTSNLCSENK